MLESDNYEKNRTGGSLGVRFQLVEMGPLEKGLLSRDLRGGE